MSCARIERAQNERLFLLEASFCSDLQEWDFIISSSKGKGETYNIRLSERESNCSCVDFSMRKSPCKHMYLIMLRVANRSVLSCEDFNGWTKSDLKEIWKKISSRTSKSEKKEGYSGEDPCAICYEEMCSDEELWSCRECKKHVHRSCMNFWLSKSNSCVYCRACVDEIRDVLESLERVCL